MITVKFETKNSHGSVKLMQMYKDISGVTLYFDKCDFKGMRQGLDEEDWFQTRQTLAVLFPDNFIEQNQMRLSLGQFIDTFAKIYNL